MQLGEQNGVAHDNWEVHINSIGVWRIKLYAVKESYFVGVTCMVFA